MSAGVLAHVHYWLAGALLLAGIYGMLAAPNIIRKLMGLNIMQTAVIIFFLVVGAKTGSQLPLSDKNGAPPAASDYANPLPHALMLTAIVVGVSTTGVALALAIRIHGHFDTLEEPELLVKLRE